MALNKWCYLSAVFSFFYSHWLLLLSKTVCLHLGEKAVFIQGVAWEWEFLYSFSLLNKKKKNISCYSQVLPQYEHKNVDRDLPSFNFFNVFLPFFSSAKVPSALGCHEVLYPTRRINFFWSCCRLQPGAVWKCACILPVLPSQHCWITETRWVA